MYNFHIKNNYDITLVGSMINYTVPYGICQIERRKACKSRKSLQHSYLVSTGMYLIKNTAINLVPLNKFYNMTDLIDDVRGRRWLSGGISYWTEFLDGYW